MSNELKLNEFLYLLNRGSYWLLNEKKTFKKRDIYDYFERTADLRTVEKAINNRKENYQPDALTGRYLEYGVDDNSSTSFLPNYITGQDGVKYYKDAYIDMISRVLAFEKLNNRSPNTVSVQNPNTASTNATSVTANETYNYFVKKFGAITDFDSALAKIKGRGYSGYYNSRYSNTACIDRMYKKQGINCTDSSQVFYKIALALGYEVQFVHVKCSSGTGHIRLRLKHSKNTGGKWIYRDPASVLNGNGVTSNWCTSNYTLIAYDPAWIFTDLN